jgi:hypothetical protein
MHILSEVTRPYIIDSITAPMGVTHFWTFSGHMMDFKLEPLEYLEETTGASIRIRVQNLEIDLPASWSLIAVDRETYTIDTIPVTACATFEHDILLFSPNDSKLVTTKLSVVDFEEKRSCIHPMIPKGSAMIHPTGPEMSNGKQIFYGIVCGPHDLYRYVGGKTVGDILG